MVVERLEPRKLEFLKTATITTKHYHVDLYIAFDCVHYRNLLDRLESQRILGVPRD